MINYRMRHSANPGEALITRRGAGKRGKDGRYKKARDNKTGWMLERVRANHGHECDRMDCLQGVIEKGTEYVQVFDPTLVKRVGYQSFPDPRKYHFGCVPDEAKPLVRFVR